MSNPNKAIGLQQDAAELARAYEEANSIQFSHGKTLIGWLNVRRGEQVLDIGAGTGQLAEYVADLVGQYGQVVGIDPFADRIAIAQSRASKLLRFGVGRGEDLSEFPDGQFDVVYLNGVFHWIEDKPRVLREIFRVLKPGGRVGLNTQDPSKPHQSRSFIRSALVDAGVWTADDGAYPALGVDAGALERLFAGAGFMGYHGELHAIVDHYDDAEAVIVWSASGAFGNFLADLSQADLDRVRSSLTKLIEVNRNESGIRLERYLRFAIARKPALDR